MVKVTRATRRKPAAEFPVVGIGASAGGIAALQALFMALKKPVGLAVIVVLHLPAERKSQLGPMIERWSGAPVFVARNGTKIQPGRVYVARGGDHLTLHRGVLQVWQSGARTRAGLDTIDTLLESLAADCGSKAIGVILSGSGADGAAGAIRIRQAEGLVFVQEPGMALHDSMPLAAITNGSADYVMSAEQIARELRAVTAPDYRAPERSPEWSGEISRTLDEIIALVRREAGLDLRGYKVAPLLWRIQRRMELRRVSNFRGYEALLREDPSELESLVRGIPIHVTEFFRDADAWRLLSDEVNVSLVRELAPGGVLKAWTPACATGEEAYSVAMLLAELNCNFQVFATDASPEIVRRASRGVFSDQSVQAVPEAWRSRYFHPVEKHWCVRKALRSSMVFAPQDLLADPPYSNLDLVTCRNLLIYLNPEASQRVLHMLHASLRLGGLLFLGKGESLAHNERGFEAISTSLRVYRKVGDVTGVKLRFPRRPTRIPKGSTLGAALRISAEELQASREEMQSLNEELRSINDQLNLANDDLAHANGLLKDKVQALETQSNVLSSGHIMAMFLDEDLHLRWFTPAMTELFPLRLGDSERPITDLTARYEDPTFTADIRAVLATDETREAEVRAADGRWFMRRVFPYRGAADAPTGVAVKFSDITDLKLAEEVLLANIAERQQRGADLGFLDEITERLARVSSIDEAMRLMSTRLAERFKVSRVLFSQVDGDHCEITHEWRAPGLPSVVARYAIKDFMSPEMERAARAGESSVIDDAAADTRVDAPRFRAVGHGGFLGMPLLRNGEWQFHVALLDPRPRKWLLEEAVLLRELAARIWVRLERAHAEERMRIAEDRYLALRRALDARDRADA
ncbi:MAG TPA: CheR family methyltransferase [Verrucomicrobiae bacterium]|nr:CheR family methyltransferase [Verrucomicrobiae bacterium]